MASGTARALMRSLDAAWFLALAGGVTAEGLLTAVLARGGHPRLDFPVALTVPGTAAARVTGAGGQLSIAAPTGMIVAGLVLVAVLLAMALGVLRQLRALFADALAGSPFGPGSARRIRIVGAAIIAAELIRGFAVLAGSLWARDNVHAPGLAFRSSFPVNPAVIGLGLLVVLLAEVFRVGAALQRDHDLTI